MTATVTRDCGAPGCDRPHAAGGWCQLHYQRMRRTGSLDAAPVLADRTESKPCQHCGGPIVRGKRKRSNWLALTYCGRACASAAQRVQRVPCSTCGQRQATALGRCHTCYVAYLRAEAADLVPKIDPAKAWRAPDNVPCRTSGDPDAWFDDPGTARHVDALRVCREVCPVSADCCAYALDIGAKHGIWGGVWFGGRP